MDYFIRESGKNVSLDHMATSLPYGAFPSSLSDAIPSLSMSHPERPNACYLPVSISQIHNKPCVANQSVPWFHFQTRLSWPLLRDRYQGKTQRREQWACPPVDHKISYHHPSQQNKLPPNKNTDQQSNVVWMQAYSSFLLAVPIGWQKKESQLRDHQVQFHQKGPCQWFVQCVFVDRENLRNDVSSWDEMIVIGFHNELFFTYLSI